MSESSCAAFGSSGHVRVSSAGIGRLQTSRLPPDSAIKRISRGISSVGRGRHRGGIESVLTASPAAANQFCRNGRAMGMNLNRRDLLFASGAFLIGGKRAFTQGASPPRAQPQTSPQARLLEALRGNRLPLTMSDGPAGRGWDWLVQQARDARLTLIGEEHGVAETAQLTAALFKAVRGSGYSRMAIELSPIIAQDIESAARRYGLHGILDFYARPNTWSPMYLREEAQFIAAVMNAAPRNERVLWGFDREIFSDRYLIARLEPKVPSRARESFARLKEASAKAWAGGAPFIFSQNPDPAVVSAVRSTWPNPDRDSDIILRTLEESLAINAVA